MSSESIPKLPIIDFNKLRLGGQNQNPNNNEWETVKSKVHKALEEYGCFEALFDKVPLNLRESLFLTLKEAFDVPSENKLLYNNVPCDITNRPFHGYVGQRPILPLHERLAINDPFLTHNIERLERTLWPERNNSNNFRKTIQHFLEQMSYLDETVRKMILESLGVEKYYEEHMNSTNYLVGLLKYHAPETQEAKLGLFGHTDRTTVSILYQNEVGGLEIETKDGKWITYHPSSPHSFVVFNGDNFHAWTNGRLHSAFHRVMIKGNETRYTIGLFSITKGGYIIKAPQELVDEEHPLLYKPYDYDDFIKYLYTKEGQSQKYALKAYCGL